MAESKEGSGLSESAKQFIKDFKAEVLKNKEWIVPIKLTRVDLDDESTWPPQDRPFLGQGHGGNGYPGIWHECIPFCGTYEAAMKFDLWMDLPKIENNKV